MRQTLVARTIQVIANEGLDKTTTKAITAGTGINEAYIYRYFSDKEDLLAKAFDELDEELVVKAMQNVSIMCMETMDYEVRCRFYFGAMWKFLLGNREKCLAFVRYYYSPYFSKCSSENHKRRYTPLIEKFSNAFKADADVWMILNHILNVMLDFAVKVHNDQMSNDDDHAEHVFRVVYRSIEQYFKAR
jgi:AcrR family transcriptional regulator